MTVVDTDKLPDWAAGNARIAELIEEHKAPAPALQQFGVEQFQAGDAATAVKAFDAAVALSPGQAIYQNNLGVALNAAGNAEGAIAAFRASLAIDQQQPQIWLNLAYTYKPLGRLEETEQALQQAANHPGTSAEAFASLGLLEMERGNNMKAAGYLAEAVKGNPGNANLHGSLGAALFQLGRPSEAAAEYKIAASLNPAEPGFAGNADFLAMIDGIMAGKAEAAITAYAKPLQEDEILLGAFNRALVFLTSFDHSDAALAMINEWLQYYPEDESALYFEQVLSGKKISRAPPGYIAYHFDRMASILDAKRLRSMEYHVPEQMVVMLAKAAGRKFQGDILDAGCGNGALGPELKPFAASLTGIDLSPRMAELAKATGLYTDVVVGDLLPFLQGKSLAYDLVAAADSLIYFGALEFVFAAAHASLRPGGWFLFSLETGSEDQAESYALMNNSRFRHTKSYVSEVGAKAFTLVRDKDMMLRLQGEKQVAGTVFLFQKA